MAKPCIPSPSLIAQAERQRRLLLSWREEARRHGATKSFLEAERRLNLLHRRDQQTLRQLAATLQHTLERQNRLIARIKAGALSPEKANQRNRRLTVEIEGLRSEITRLNKLFSAQSSDDLGGIVKLPLTEYPSAVGSCRPPLWTPLTPRDRRQIIAAGVLLVVSVLAVLRLTLWREGVEFQLIPPGSVQGLMLLRCTNQTAYPIVLCAPARPTATLHARMRVFNIDLFGKTAADDKFQLFPDTGDAWNYQGMPTSRIEPIIVNPGLSAELTLDPARLPSLGAPLQTLQATCSLTPGKRVYKAVITIPR